MIRRLLTLILSAALLLLPLCHAEDDFLASAIIENVPPSEPIITESAAIQVTAEYIPETNQTRYTAILTENSPVSAQDMLFTLYVHLDPGCESPLAALDIPGLESYRRQTNAERLSTAAEAMSAIHAAGPDHARTDADPWTQGLQDTYWSLRTAYDDACAREFPACAQAIVDYCDQMLAGSRGAFGMNADAIAQDDGLRIAYAMLQWGYADAEDALLTGRRSGKAWQLTEQTPAIQDFVHELSLAYDGDLGACWKIETTGTHEPILPSVDEPFLDAYLAEAQDSIPRIEGIRLIDDRTIEVLLTGINMREAGILFAQPVLSLSQQGDAELWNPEEGLYGHPFGDVSGIDLTQGSILLEPAGEITF